MGVTAYHRANLLKAETTHYTLGEFNIVNNNIIQALEDNKKENFKSSRSGVANNESSAKNDLL